MNKLIINIISLIITTIGLIYIISYLNLLVIGYNILDYVYFMIREFECIMFFIGLIILIINNKEDT